MSTARRLIPLAKGLIPVAGALCSALTLAACAGGSSASSKSSQASPGHTSATSATQAASTSTTLSTLPPPSAVTPQTLVASVWGKPIRFATVKSIMAVESAPEPVPDPPSYATCIAYAKAAAQKAGETAPAEAQIKQNCQQRYEKLLGPAVSKAIHNQWLLGEAREAGIAISEEAVLREYDASKKSYKTSAEFENSLKSTGQSVPEVLQELRIGQIADAIFKLIKEKERTITPAIAAAYYAAHPQQFTVPEGRDVRILRTTSQASAINAVKELQAGRSFAELAKQLSQIGQPIGAEEGEVKDLLPGIFEEKSLNDPIFAAQLNHLYGPLQITAAHKTIAPETNSGFFIYEVKRMIPAKLTPLSQVEAKIAASLTEAQKNSTLSGFIAAFRAKWTARTDCQAAFVVRNCKQFKGAHPGEEDPYTL